MIRFAAGFTSALALCGLVLIFNRIQSESIILEKERKDRKRRFDSLCRALDLSSQKLQSEHLRAMVAICYSEQLIFEVIEPRLLRFLGYVGDVKMPENVYDLLPSSMEQYHRQWVSKAVRDGQLPERLRHPLRSVNVRHASGHYIQMDLIIENVPGTSNAVFQLIFASLDTSAAYQLQTLCAQDQVRCETSP